MIGINPGKPQGKKNEILLDCTMIWHIAKMINIHSGNQLLKDIFD